MWTDPPKKKPIPDFKKKQKAWSSKKRGQIYGLTRTLNVNWPAKKEAHSKFFFLKRPDPARKRVRFMGWPAKKISPFQIFFKKRPDPAIKGVRFMGWPKPGNVD
jgi:hypothetical protein